jgi:putative ABC transport system permease protein
MDALRSDIRYALRLWSRSPGFTAVAVLTLALGIGANTTMFSVVNSTVLRELPFPWPDRLVSVWQGTVSDPRNLSIVSLPNYRDWSQRSRSFAHLALFDSAGRGYNLSGGSEPEQVAGVRVTASFFDVLGVRPALGRTFSREEEQPGRDRVVILSHGLWTRRYGADPSVVGRAIRMDGQAYVVVGVMPANFTFQFWSAARELWVPAGWTVGDESRGSNSFICIGRLKPGVSLASARSEMDTIGRALARQFSTDNVGQTVRVVAMQEYGIEELRPALLGMSAVVGLVLLIACVNVANLMLARAAVRQREVAIRAALGASRRRVMQQLLTESILLSLLGGVAGLLFAVWGTSLLFPMLPDDLRRIPLRPLDRLDIDASVLAFTWAASLGSGVLFGLAPAFTSLRGDVNEALKNNSRAATGGGRGGLRYLLVAAEVALTLVALAGAAALIVSVARVLGVDPGLDTRNVLVMEASLPQENLYYGPPTLVRFCADLQQHVGSVPGVVSVSGIAHLPLSGSGAGRSFVLEGKPDPGPERRPDAGYSVACPNILRTMGIALVRGREFTDRDAVGVPGVALINERMASSYWPGEEVIGKRFKPGGLDSEEPWLTVVGVFRDIRHSGLDRQLSPLFLRPYSQAGWPVMSIVVKTASAPVAFVAPVKKAFTAVVPDQAVSGVRTMDDVVGESVSSRRFPMLLLSGFALLALVLAAVGIAGVVAYSVVQQQQEIGLRMALGAQPRDVLRLVVGHSMWWTFAGLGAGLVGSFGMLRVLGSLLYGVDSSDLTVLAAVSLLLAVVALAASYVPARRALRVDPVAALRWQ